ncbi:MAG: PAC2 family protein [Candidatus Marsarchaeota archaeon]|nr:PAC2 family protein [Candidatus Marsarchaeota archaeon]MCL5105864.1 PAC2 family protein [Candidatus Marsarchaeota archaeon]
MIDFANTTIIKSSKSKIQSKNAVFIVGLPGLGSIGSIVVDLLIKQFKGVPIATIYSNKFPPHVLMLENGEVRFLNNTFYLIKGPNKKNDLVLLAGDTQAMTPEGQYEINAKIINFFKNEINGKFMLAIGGYAQQENEIKSPRVFGNVTDKKLIERFKNYDIKFNQTRGLIYGSLGLLMAMAKSDNLEGLCLMGEVQNMELDPNAVKSVVAVLNKLLGITINTKDIDELIKTMDKTNAKLLQDLNMPGALNNEESQPSYIR